MYDLYRTMIPRSAESSEGSEVALAATNKKLKASAEIARNRVTWQENVVRKIKWRKFLDAAPAPVPTLWWQA
jgi:hypothetical protein